MTATVEELERRVEELSTRIKELEKARPADLRRAVTTESKLLEETRLRMSAVEQELQELNRNIFELIAENAKAHGSLQASIDRVSRDVSNLRSDFNGLRTDVSSLRRDLPGMIVAALQDWEASKK